MGTININKLGLIMSDIQWTTDYHPKIVPRNEELILMILAVRLSTGGSVRLLNLKADFMFRKNGSYTELFTGSINYFKFTAEPL